MTFFSKASPACRGLAVLGLLSPFAVACSSSPEAPESASAEITAPSALEAAFADRAEKECERYFTCMPFSLKRFGMWPTKAACVAEKKAKWAERAAMPGIVVHAAKQEACATRVAQLTCLDFLSATHRTPEVELPECRVEQNGLLAAGAVCQDDAQCAGGLCDRAMEQKPSSGGGVTAFGPADCGTCAVAKLAGETCTLDMGDPGGPAGPGSAPSGPPARECAAGLACLPRCTVSDFTKGGVFDEAGLEQCMKDNPGGACADPSGGASGFTPHAGTLPLGASCTDTSECAQSMTDLIACDPTNHCAPASRTNGTTCDPERLGFLSQCNEDQAGLECATACDYGAFFGPNGFDQAGYDACLLQNPPKCAPVDLGANLGEACGMITSATGFHTQDCRAGFYCKFANVSDETGACAAQAGLGKGCDPLAGTWGSSCGRGLDCDATTSTCVAEKAVICTQPTP